MSIKAKQSKLVFESRGTIRALRPLHIAQDLSYNFGEDVMIYDVRERTPYVSYYIVASSQNERRLRALVQTAKEAAYDSYKEVEHTEGRNDSTWILIDCKDIVIQLFTKAAREEIRFDDLYQDCPKKLVVCKEEPTFKRRPKPVKEY